MVEKKVRSPRMGKNTHLRNRRGPSQVGKEGHKTKKKKGGDEVTMTQGTKRGKFYRSVEGARIYQRIEQINRKSGGAREKRKNISRGEGTGDLVGKEEKRTGLSRSKEGKKGDRFPRGGKEKERRRSLSRVRSGRKGRR